MGCTERRKGDRRVDRLEGEVSRDLGERIFGKEVRVGVGVADASVRGLLGGREEGDKGTDRLEEGMGFQFFPLIQQVNHMDVFEKQRASSGMWN